ncbi:MAG: type II toxin-antitoxin system VapC family toxin [Sterolibacteriaceae bacterium]|jgi:tRNA(fMet)-specific endonuclease VapC|uniref:Ribonuclease VapC n=1 Tax=Candidatus Methylophosphatis roskildensis TaxID=2899263 RepID=A0A9D7HMW5_9PROT|nr:type II toxin-antitoxin system VapC family toxin [Candidatus Methylophosphatis roskildensis]MBK7236161.1 type II toxin-antitoxin system VapC family toxin [Sterolibacteriaceae bacterium]MBK7665454.1 type II toxin-antitoxin system VapC family toxin [Sterolibacteriaceae bacterium]MBK9085703.1 type II toxin-antitoxin system VapC family toxin [Sterolibacteriaceae bacterium]
MRYLLDTNILIALSKERPGVTARLANIPANDILLSAVVVAEIEYGIAKSTRREHNRRVFDTLLAGIQIIPFDEAAARLYGPIRAELERLGEVIGPYDLMIAAQALSHDAVLVTDNLGEFGRVAGLAVENWLN